MAQEDAETTSGQMTEAFAGRVFESVLGMLDGWSIYVGDKLGWYDALAGQARTRDELAAATDTHWRYVGEWLEQQVTTGFLEVDNAAAAPDERHYSLPAAHREVLVDRDSLNYLAPFVRLVTAGGIQLPGLLEAYRSGGGVAWEQFGPDMRTGQAEMNRPWFISALGTDWFPSAPALHDRLSQPGARVADVGCGEGWSSIAMARWYPELTVDGYDIDEASMLVAGGHATAAGVSERVRFRHVDAAAVDGEEIYDVVTLFECVHDMSQPVGVLAAVRRMVKPDGLVVVMDEAVADEFGLQKDDVERLMYGFSMFICLPDGMSHQPSAATGTVMRPSQLREYAKAAGFADVSVLPIENDLWRFYQLDL